MKVMLVKDVYKLGRAGDIKKVADGYGRNFLLPQGFAVLATAAPLRADLRDSTALLRGRRPLGLGFDLRLAGFVELDELVGERDRERAPEPLGGVGGGREVHRDRKSVV